MQCGLLFFQLFVVLFTLSTSIPLGCLVGPIGVRLSPDGYQKNLAFVQFIHSYYSYPSSDCWHLYSVIAADVMYLAINNIVVVVAAAVVVELLWSSLSSL